MGVKIYMPHNTCTVHILHIVHLYILYIYCTLYPLCTWFTYCSSFQVKKSKEINIPYICIYHFLVGFQIDVWHKTSHRFMKHYLTKNTLCLSITVHFFGFVFHNLTSNNMTYHFWSARPLHNTTFGLLHQHWSATFSADGVDQILLKKMSIFSY